MRFLMLFFPLCVSVSHVFSQFTLQKKWETDAVWKVPESVCIDPKEQVLYISNIDGSNAWAKDGKGSIGKMRMDGTILQTEWIKGLQAPKGMGIYKGMLYVADLNEIVLIDISKQEIKKKIAVPQAEQLNDVAIDPKGTVYISDTKGKRIYVMKGGTVSPHVEGLAGPNGIAWHKDHLYLLDRGALFRVEYDRSLTVLADGIEGGADGIAVVSDTDMIVSGWAGVLYLVNLDGKKYTLLDTRDQKVQSADICYDPLGKTLFVPTFFSNKVLAYTLQ